MAGRASSATTPAAPDAARDIPVAVGDVVADKYVIEKVVGAGGVGVVFSAEHRGLGEKVAIKFLQRAAASAENLARFDREARALARIKSEHVARIMDIGALPTGEPFMVMELLLGSDFATLLRERGRVPIADAVDWIVQACEALALSHGVGIVHRDLKPANLFLTQTAEGAPIVKVLDFGISKLCTSDGRDQAMTQTLSVIGSPLYMSPEQMESPKDADERADVWSLGVILYELIAGKAPFEAPTLPILCARICTAPHTPLETHVPDVPPALSAAIARCLEKNRDARFSSVGELARAVAPFSTSPVGPESGSRRLAWDSSPPPAPTATPKRRRSRTFAVAIAAVVALVAIGVGWSARPAPRRGPGVQRWADNYVLKTWLGREVARGKSTAAIAPVAPLSVPEPEPAPVESSTAAASSAQTVPATSAKRLPRVTKPVRTTPSGQPIRAEDVLRER